MKNLKNVRIALIGCGGIARQHVIRYHAHPKAEIVALQDVAEDQINRMDARLKSENSLDILGGIPRFTDAAELYRVAKPDAVSICTPHTLHYEHCCAALEAGCHVLVEKPMVTSSAQAADLEQRVKKSGKILQVAYITPSKATCRRLREICAGKEYGRLQVVNCTISQFWYAPTKGTWRHDPALSGGGMAYDSGAHVFNTLIWTVDQPVAEVHAFLDNLDAAVDINGTINVRFVDGTLACVAVCGEAPSGSTGVWNFERANVYLDPWQAKEIRVVAFQDGKAQEVDSGMTRTDSCAQDNFIDSLTGKDEPVTAPRNGVLQSQLMDAIYASAESGQSIKIDHG